jgi:hypothetical protein
MNALEYRVPPPLVCFFFAAVMLVVSRLTPAIQIEDIVRLAITGFFAVSALVFGAPAFMAFCRAKTTTDEVCHSHSISSMSPNPLTYNMIFSAQSLNTDSRPVKKLPF